jgi:hypothetical protein
MTHVVFKLRTGSRGEARWVDGCCLDQSSSACCCWCWLPYHLNYLATAAVPHIMRTYFLFNGSNLDHLQDAACIDGQRDMDALRQSPEAQDKKVANQRRALVHDLRGTLHHTALAQQSWL